MGCKCVFCDSPVGESKEFIMSNYFDPPFHEPLACAKSIKFEMDDQLLGANVAGFCSIVRNPKIDIFEICIFKT